MICSWFMGVDALQGNGITRKILYFFQDKALTPLDDPLDKVRKSRILLFVVVQLIGFAITFGITQTIGAYRYILNKDGLIWNVWRYSRHCFPCGHTIARPSTGDTCSAFTFYGWRIGDSRRTYSVSLCEHRYFQHISWLMLSLPDHGICRRVFVRYVYSEQLHRSVGSFRLHIKLVCVPVQTLKILSGSMLKDAKDLNLNY